MPYGRGHSKAELDQAKQDNDTTTYIVTTACGSKLIASGEQSAKVLAGKDGTYQKAKQAGPEDSDSHTNDQL